ncbi:death domain-associated protein 6 [Nothobranchius furzeri]|uniref:death domain-associated protein 6 n=1 Tax=Nothobranchius furzeri TaxID=105023 RepID=UPI00077D174F
MAVAPASLADQIIVLEDDEPACSSATSSSSKRQTSNVSPARRQQQAPTHIVHSPFASNRKSVNALQAENQKLFSVFLEHCTSLTKDCPEVLTFLQTKHAKASAEFLSSVEFRNTLGRCLTRAQANSSKTFVYINELCTVLKQHSVKKRPALSQAEPSASTSGATRSAPDSLQSKTKVEEEEEGKPAAERASTSGGQEVKEESEEAQRKAKRALRKQIAHLENLLKSYNDEISRLQQAELTLDDMETEDSTYIQEHKLKRKMMKIYEKLCELKGCNTLTGRVIEQKIKFNTTRFPEINRKIERFINSPEARSNPPDYHDIRQLVVRVNERHNLCLNRKQVSQIAQEAFRDTGSLLQERRHLDLVYNFGSRLTDAYKPADDPALSDLSLLKKLRSNREVALSRLDDVIKKYAVKQDDTEEQERIRRLEKNGKEKEKPEEGKQTSQANGVEEEEEDEEEDESSDPDIEEEIQASTQQAAADDDEEEEEEENANEAGQSCEDDKEDQTYEQTGSAPAGGDGSPRAEMEPLTSESPVSEETQMSSVPSPRDSPGQSELVQSDTRQTLSNGTTANLKKLAASNQLSVVIIKENQVNNKKLAVPAAVNGDPSPERGTPKTSESPPPSPRTTRSQKRKREENMAETPRNLRLKISYDSDADIPLDMGVISCSSPQDASTPSQLICSPQLTPPPKKNKVNVATQCDPDEIIVLSDSE